MNAHLCIIISSIKTHKQHFNRNSQEKETFLRPATGSAPWRQLLPLLACFGLMSGQWLPSIANKAVKSVLSNVSIHLTS